MFLKGFFAFIFTLVAVAIFSPLHADTKGDFVFTDEGLECRIPVISPWQKMPAYFGFSSMLYQQTKDDDRVTFGLVITPFSGETPSDENPQKAFEEFHQDKKEFIEEYGGHFIGPAPSLLGKDAHKTFRASVDYHLDGVDYRDSTYFRFVNGRFIHAKVIFPLKKFNEKTVEEQTTQLLAGMSCSPAN